MHSTCINTWVLIWKYLDWNLFYKTRRAWVGNLKQRVPITRKSSNFKGETHHYVVKLPKSAGARQYCSKIPRVPGTLGTLANSSPVKSTTKLEYGAYLVSQLKMTYYFFELVPDSHVCSTVTCPRRYFINMQWTET